VISLSPVESKNPVAGQANRPVPQGTHDLRKGMRETEKNEGTEKSWRSTKKSMKQADDQLLFSRPK
jgi:hypothetical protein